MPEGKEVLEGMPLEGKKAPGWIWTAVVDTWTNMVYWRGVKAALAVGRDSCKPIGPL